MNRENAMRSNLMAWKWKAALIRYRVVRQAASLRLALRPVRDRIYVWPPFETKDDVELVSLQSEIAHYLSGFDIEINYYMVDENGLTECRFNTSDVHHLNRRQTHHTSVEDELTRARFRVLWSSEDRPRIGSLRPHLYFVSQAEGSVGGVNEWLRLVGDIYLDRFTTPRRIARFSGPVESCAVLGSGPSLDRFFSESDRWSAWIGCNFLVCDDRIHLAKRPIAYCASDPFLYSSANIFRVYRERLFQFLRETDAVYVTLMDYAPFIEMTFPEDVKQRCHYVKTLGHDTFRTATGSRVEDLTITPYGNVLTDLMLPVASCLSRRVGLYGCDGRPAGQAEVPKSLRMQECEDACYKELSHTKSINPPNYIDKFGLYTGYVVEECMRRGVEFVLRDKSWNPGFAGLPLLAELPESQEAISLPC